MKKFTFTWLWPVIFEDDELSPRRATSIAFNPSLTSANVYYVHYYLGMCPVPNIYHNTLISVIYLKNINIPSIQCLQICKLCYRTVTSSELNSKICPFTIQHRWDLLLQFHVKSIIHLILSLLSITLFSREPSLSDYRMN